jgi:PadR family transcriptional regulator PadR
MSDALDVQWKEGLVELCALALLSRGESYAYELAKQLSEQIGMGEGTIYPLMRRLQTDGLVDTYLVESSSGPPRKYYRLTKAGKAECEKQRAAWAHFSRAVNVICNSSEPRHVRRRSA